MSNQYYKKAKKVYGQPGIDKGVSTYLNAPLIISNSTIKMGSVMQRHAENTSQSQPLLQQQRPHIEFINNDIRERAHEFLLRYMANDTSVQMESPLFRRFHHVLSSYDALLTDAEKQVRDTLERRRVSLNAMAARLELNSNLQNSPLSRTLESLQKQMQSATAEMKDTLTRRITRLSSSLIRLQRSKIAPASAQNGTCMYHTFIFSIPPGLGLKYILEVRDRRQDQVLINNNSRNNNSKVRVPIRGSRGDRLLKRAIVIDSILPAIHAIMTLPTDNTGVTSTRSPFLKRYQQDPPPPCVDETFTWTKTSVSFGNRGPQQYWIQFIRELYDHRRMRNVMKVVKSRNGRNVVARALGLNNVSVKSMNKKKDAKPGKQPVASKNNLRATLNRNATTNTTTTKLENHAVDSTRKFVNAFKSLRSTLDVLPANLGVTEYGYTADVNNVNAEWTMSYHRLGRRWYLDDVDSSSVQLPFGAFSDSFLHEYRVQSVSKKSAHPAGLLLTVIQNTIASCVLSRSDERGTGGRYGHVHTSGISTMKPVEVFKLVKSLRSYKGSANDTYTAARILRYTEPTNRSSMAVRGEAYKMMFGPSVEFLALRASGLFATSSSIEDVDIKTVDATAFKRVHEDFDSRLRNDTGFLKDAFESSARNMQNVYASNDSSKVASRLRTDIPQVRKNAIVKGKVSGNSNANSPKTFGRVTAYNIKPSELERHAYGLSQKFHNTDATTLDDAVLLIDSEVYCGVEAPFMVTHGGGNDALGVSSTFDGDSGNMVLPQITPITRVDNVSYTQMRSAADKFAALLRKDADASLSGLVQRIMENVFDPLITGGGVSRGMHMSDLMARFSHIVDSLDLKSAALVDSLFKHDKYYSMIRALVFYMYSSAGLSQRAALDRLLLVEASRDQNAIRLQQLNLIVRLRLVGEHGFAPTPMFRRIVKQFFATTNTNSMTKTYSYDQVWREVESIRKSMMVLKLPRSFRRYLYRDTGTPLTSAEAVRGGRTLVPSARWLTNLTGIRPDAAKSVNVRNRRM